MRNRALFLILFGIFCSHQSGAQARPSAQADSVYTLMISGIRPAHVNWVKNAAKVFNSKSLKAEDATGMALGYGVAVLGSMPDGDIEALAFLVLMEAAKSAQEDLKSVMASVKAINNAKAKQREILDRLNKLSAKMAGKPENEKIESYIDTYNNPASGRNNFSRADYNFRLARSLDSLIKRDQLNLNWKLSSYLLDNTTTKGDVDVMVDKAKSDLDSMSEMGEMESLRLQMAMDRLSKMFSTLSNLLKKASDTAQSITQNLK